MALARKRLQQFQKKRSKSSLPGSQESSVSNLSYDPSVVQSPYLRQSSTENLTSLLDGPTSTHDLQTTANASDAIVSSATAPGMMMPASLTDGLSPEEQETFQQTVHDFVLQERVRWPWVFCSLNLYVGRAESCRSQCASRFKARGSTIFACTL